MLKNIEIKERVMKSYYQCSFFVGVKEFVSTLSKHFGILPTKIYIHLSKRCLKKNPAIYFL